MFSISEARPPGRHQRQAARRASPWLLLAALTSLSAGTALLSGLAPAVADRHPNVVLLLADDLGYADVGVFGAQNWQTPNLDGLAAQGRKFTDFYVAASVCTASRAALMTGSYPVRVTMFGALNHTSREGIHPDEFLLPEALKKAGYATACYGKWHLGTVVEFFPTRNGFDEFFGIPYSNDNSKYHPVVQDMPPLPLYDGERVVAFDSDQSEFTRRLTERAVTFINRNKGRPFFLYVPHIMPHVPIFASDRFRGTRSVGLYGDVIQEIDWSVGQILEALESNGLTSNTLVIFMSDNGPFLSYGEHAGHADPLREGKLTTFEGGFRTPCLMRWPGVIPGGTQCDQVASAMDLLPTLAKRVGVELPPDRVIDGKDIWPLMIGTQGAESPYEAFHYYAGQELQAVRSGDWKLHFAHSYLTTFGTPGTNGYPSGFGKLKPNSITSSGLEGIASRHGYRVEELPKSLYNLRRDPGETENVIDEHPEIVGRLEALAERIRGQLGDSLTGTEGQAVRPRATIFNPNDPRLLIPQPDRPGEQADYIRPE